MSDGHNVFISWSGERSRAMAVALDQWLRRVIQAANPFFSKEIDRGSFWHESIRASLKSVRFGIVCVTPENIGAPWLNYEAGALAEQLDGHTVPWLLGSKPEALKDSPMSRLQASTADRDGTFGVVQALNASLGKPVADAILLDVFGDAWPRLEMQLQAIPPAETKTEKRAPDDMLEEIVRLCRQIALDQANVRKTAMPPRRRPPVKFGPSLTFGTVQDDDLFSPEAVASPAFVDLVTELANAVQVERSTSVDLQAMVERVIGVISKGMNVARGISFAEVRALVDLSVRAAT